MAASTTKMGKGDQQWTRQAETYSQILPYWCGTTQPGIQGYFFNNIKLKRYFKRHLCCIFISSYCFICTWKIYSQWNEDNKSLKETWGLLAFSSALKSSLDICFCLKQTEVNKSVDQHSPRAACINFLGMISSLKSIWLKSFSNSLFASNSILFLNLNFSLLNRKTDSPEIYCHKKEKFSLQIWNSELLFFRHRKFSIWSTLYLGVNQKYSRRKVIFVPVPRYSTLLNPTHLSLFSPDFATYHLAEKARQSIWKTVLWGNATWMCLETLALFLTTCELIQGTRRCKSPICSLRCLLIDLFS